MQEALTKTSFTLSTLFSEITFEEATQLFTIMIKRKLTGQERVLWNFLIFRKFLLRQLSIKILCHYQKEINTIIMQFLRRFKMYFLVMMSSKKKIKLMFTFLGSIKPMDKMHKSLTSNQQINGSFLQRMFQFLSKMLMT